MAHHSVEIVNLKKEIRQLNAQMKEFGVSCEEDHLDLHPNDTRKLSHLQNQMVEKQDALNNLLTKGV